MRSFTKTLLIAALMVALGFGAYAELQNVLVSGSIRIRGNMYDFDDGAIISGAATGDEVAWVEQRTRLGVQADFTDNVSAFIELDSYDNWGEDFRSNYITGIDGRAATGDDVEIYQAYIEATEMWDTPLYMRVGRQELALGSQWLVGVQDTAALFTGLSFDAVVLGYGTDMVDVKLIWAKLNETFGDFGDDDVDLYALYGSYLGLEDIVIDAYWMYVRDDQSLTVADVDLHTIGLRGAGVIGAFDFEAEVAYQFGEYDLPNFLWWDNDTSVSAWGINLEAGYTFDVAWQPRVYLGFAWLEGADVDRRWWPFREPDNDVAFNRLFSNWEYTEFIENTDLSNVFVYRAGISVQPTESLDLLLAAAYFMVDEEVDEWRFLWWSKKADDKLGLELGLYADYQYSEDLVFRAGWAHFFADDGMEAGNLVTGNGFLPIFGDDSDDYDYLFLETEISF
jgi:hypothetical protein